MDTSIVRYDLCMHHAHSGKQYGCSDFSYEGITWLETTEPKPTQEELEAVWETIKVSEADKEVAQVRSMAYPTLDQLIVALWEKLVEVDGLTSDDIAALQALRLQVKANNPKG